MDATLRLARTVGGGRMNTETQRAGWKRRAENMSAPPRSTVTVRPIALEPATPRTAENPEPELPPCGLRLVARICIDELIRARTPDALARPWRAATADTDALRLDPDYRRLLAAVALTRAATGEGRADLHAPRTALPPAEALQDELVANVRRLDGRALRLPACGFFRDGPDTGELRDAPREDDVARALFILCHRYGDLFLRDADPIACLSGLTVDLIAAEGGAA